MCKERLPTFFIVYPNIKKKPSEKDTALVNDKVMDFTLLSPEIRYELATATGLYPLGL